MKSAAQIILAIAPGSREFGVAVFSERELIYFAVRTLPRGRSAALQKEEVSELLLELFANFKPQLVVLRAVSKYQQTSVALREIVKFVKRQAKAREIPVTEISLEQVKSFFQDAGKDTQKRAFQTLANLYPELRQFSSRPSKWQSDYYHNLLSAVLIGVVCLKSLAES
jgi:RNase H-fold protein (predicted Holliday junction resolvase)